MWAKMEKISLLRHQQILPPSLTTTLGYRPARPAAIFFYPIISQIFNISSLAINAHWFWLVPGPGPELDDRTIVDEILRGGTGKWKQQFPPFATAQWPPPSKRAVRASLLGALLYCCFSPVPDEMCSRILRKALKYMLLVPPSLVLRVHFAKGLLRPCAHVPVTMMITSIPASKVPISQLPF